MIYEEPTLGKINVDMLIRYIEALTPPASAPASDSPAEEYRAGFATARAAARRLVMDMWRAAEVVQVLGQDVYVDNDDDNLELPEGCCGRCPPIVGGGVDCTCADNPRCPNYSTPPKSEAKDD